MRTVKVKVSELLGKIKKNREAHRAVFLEACEGYREKSIAELEKMLAEAKDGKRIRRYVELVEPMDMTKEYDQVIAMLEMSNDDVVELTHTEFQNYVQDDWSWKEQFTANNTRYLKS